MITRIHEVQGYAIVTNKVAFVTRVFKAKADEGFQFNIALSGDVRVSARFPTRHEADLERELLLKSVREA
jgi:hypothetical protein